MRPSIIQLVAGMVILIVITLLASQGRTTSLQRTPAGEPIVPKPPSQRFLIIGEIASFEARAGLDSLKKHGSLLDSVSLFWYEIEPDGKVVLDPPVTEVMEEDAIASAKTFNLEILLGVGNDGDSDFLDAPLFDSETQRLTIERLVTRVEAKGYNGLVLDFEGLRSDQTESYSDFVRLLSLEIHARGKKLAVATNTELSGRVYDGIDIVDVSRYADRLDLNSFEEYGEWSGPGPIASIGWVERIIENVLTQGVSGDKVVVGTAHSGHDWIVSPEVSFVSDVSTKVILDLFLRVGAELQFDEEYVSHFFRYQDRQGRQHVVWLEDGVSMREKMKFAQRKRLGGLFIWFLGGEDADVWDVIREFKSLN